MVLISQKAEARISSTSYYGLLPLLKNHYQLLRFFPHTFTHRHRETPKERFNVAHLIWVRNFKNWTLGLWVLYEIWHRSLWQLVHNNHPLYCRDTIIDKKMRGYQTCPKCGGKTWYSFKVFAKNLERKWCENCNFLDEAGMTLFKNWSFLPDDASRNQS